MTMKSLIANPAEPTPAEKRSTTRRDLTRAARVARLSDTALMRNAFLHYSLEIIHGDYLDRPFAVSIQTSIIPPRQ